MNILQQSKKSLVIIGKVSEQTQGMRRGTKFELMKSSFRL